MTIELATATGYQLYELYREFDYQPAVKAAVCHALGDDSYDTFLKANGELDHIRHLLHVTYETWSASNGVLLEDAPRVVAEVNRLRARREAQRIVDGEETPHDQLLRSRLVHGLDLADLPEPGWLIDGVLPGSSLTLMYGPKGNGKSFVTVDMAMSITYGCHWAGRQVRQASVLYVIGEGASGMHKRQEAWLEHHEPTGTGEPVLWLPHRINLMDDHQVDELVEIVEGEQVGVVVIDTLNRCSFGADENSPRDMGQIVASLDRIRDAGATALPVHHAGKDLSKGARGHSALLGAADAVFRITGGDRRIRLDNEWQKDAEAAAPVSLHMVDVARSIALDAYDAALAVPESIGAALRILDEIAPPEGISTSAWQQACGDEGISKASFYRAVKWGRTSRQVMNLGTDKRPKYVRSDGETDET